MAELTKLGFLAIVASLAMLGCGGDSMSCNLPYAGDSTRPIEATAFVLDVSADESMVTPIEVHDGDAAPLIIPQQGGFVVFAGLRLKNLSPCKVTITGEFLDDTGTSALTNRDSRQTDLVPSTAGGGWYESKDLVALSTVPNIPVCPNFLGTNVADVPAILKLTATDRSGKTVTVTTHVSPSCQHPDTRPFCQCTCGANYFPGKCSLDGGVASGDGGGP
jgi:hypothetical protein